MTILHLSLLSLVDTKLLLRLLRQQVLLWELFSLTTLLLYTIMNLSTPNNSLEPISLSDPSVLHEMAPQGDVLHFPSVQPGGTLLPPDFEPSKYDVVCGRGKGCEKWIGNKRFRVTIAMNKERYMKAPTKLDKSLVVDEIVKTISTASPNGGFIKKDACTGQWYKISEQQARDKVGHAMRDAVQANERKARRQRNKRRSLYNKRSSKKAAAVPMTTTSSDNVVPMEVASNPEVVNQVSSGIRESFRSSFKDPDFAAYILETLGPQENDISLFSESALFHSLTTGNTSSSMNMR